MLPKCLQPFISIPLKSPLLLLSWKGSLTCDLLAVTSILLTDLTTLLMVVHPPEICFSLPLVEKSKYCLSFSHYKVQIPGPQPSSIDNIMRGAHCDTVYWYVCAYKAILSSVNTCRIKFMRQYQANCVTRRENKNKRGCGRENQKTHLTYLRYCSQPCLEAHGDPFSRISLKSVFSWQ